MVRSRARDRRERTKRTGSRLPSQLVSLPWVWVATGLWTLGMAIISFGFWTVGGYGVETDALAGYLPDAQRLLDGAFTTLDGFKGPGYHLALAAAGLVVRDLFVAAKLVALVSAAAVLILTFRMTARYVSTKVAWLVWAILATNAQFVLYTIQVGTDMYFLVLAVAAAYFILVRPGASRPVQVRWMLLAGAIAGMAYLTRYNGLFLIAGGCAILLLSDWKEIPEVSETSDARRLPWKTRICRTASFLVGAIAVILPWGIFTASKGRGFFYNRNYLNIAYEMYGRDKVAWDQYWEYFREVFHGFGDVVSGNIGGFVAMAVRNGVANFWNDMNRVLIAGDAAWGTVVAALWSILIFFGLFVVIRKYRWRCWPPLLLGLLTYGVLVPVFYGERFSMPMLPWYGVLAAVATMWAFARASWPETGRYAPAAALAVLLLAGAHSTYAETSSLLAHSPVEVLLVADSVEGRVEPGAGVLARKPHIAWHLGLVYRGIPIIQSIAELPDVAVERNAKYLFVSGIEAALRRPLIPLLDPRNAPAFLRPIAATRGRPAVLYEFLMPIDPPPPAETVVYVPPDRTHEPPLPVRLGNAYAEAGRYDLAREQYERMLASDPGEPTAQYGVIMLDVRQARAILRDPQATDAARAAARSRLDSAERRLGDLAERYPDSFMVQKWHGGFLAGRTRYEEARAAYRRALEIDPDNAEVLDALHRLDGAR